MARRTDHLWEEPGDDYTPATDLIFSMFAMTVLLLALFGAGDHVKTVDSGTRITIEKEKVDALERDNRALSDRLARFVLAEDALREQQKKAARTSPLDTPAKLLAERDEAIALADDYRRRLETLQGRIDFTQIRLGTLDETAAGPFMAAAAGFSPAVRDRLLALVAARAGDVATIRANRLVFEISTSAELGAAADGTDLDMKEAMNWGEALMRAMRPTALPVGCLAVLPSGKLHSAHLHELADRPGGGKAVDDFERLLGLKRVPEPIRRRIEAARGGDRSITVWAQSVPSESCDPSVLAAAARALAAGAR